MVNYSWVYFFKDSMRQGIFPLWNPLSFCGYPYGTDAVSSVSIVNILALLLNNVNWAWNIITIGSVLLAACFTYLYLRHFKYSRFSGIVAGIIFAFAPSSGCYVDSWGFFLPLVIWLAEIYAKSKKPWMTVVTFLSFALLILNALPQYSFYIGGFFTLYVWFRFRSLWGFWVVIFSLGASSFYTFRLFELLTLSPRGQLWFLNVLLPTHLIQMIFPFFFESPFRPETDFFFSKGFYHLCRVLFHTDKIQYLIPPYITILGISAVLYSFKKERISQFYWRFLFAILFYLMTFPILAPVYKHIPFLAQLPRLERLGTVFTFVLAVLSGIGIHRIEKMEVRTKRVERFYLALICGALTMLLAIRFLVFRNENMIHSFLNNYVKTHVVGAGSFQASEAFYLQRINLFFTFIDGWTNILNPSITISFLFILFSSLTIGLYIRKKISLKVFHLAAIGVLILDLLIFYRLTQYSGSSPKDLRPERKSIAFLQKDPDLFRIMPVLDPADFGDARERQMLAPNTNLLYGIASVEGYDPLFPDQYSVFFKNFQTNYEPDPAMVLAGPEGSFDRRIADFLNVKYLIASKKNKLRAPFRLIFEDEDAKIYFNAFYLPRGFLVHNYQVFKEKQQILSFLKSSDMKFDQMVVLEERAGFEPSKGNTNVKNQDVKFEKYTSQAVEVLVTTSRHELFVLSDNYFPGWKAFVDNIPHKIYKANYAFRAVEVEPGTHQIRFIYEPASLKLGLLTSLVFVFLGFIVLIIQQRSL